MPRLLPVTLTLLVISSMTACSPWESRDDYTTAVFSDDGKGIAAIHLTYKAKDTVTHTKMKDHHVQLLMKENTNASAPGVLTPVLEGNVMDLFFMRTEGYVILGRKNNWLGSVEGGDYGDFWYDKIDMNGKITPIANGNFAVGVSCNQNGGTTSLNFPIRVIPSPDGKLLALVESETTCTERIQTLTFLHASNLSLAGGPFDIPDVEGGSFAGLAGDMLPPMEMAWRTDGGFATAFWGNGPNFDSHYATVFHLGSEPETNVVMDMDCFHPATASSDVNASGQAVSIDEGNGQITVGGQSGGGGFGPGAGSSNLVFGCSP